MGSPLYRQEQELHRQGIQLSRQTMSNWILRAAEEYLAPVYEQLHRELLGREVLHADETTLQVLREPGRAPQSESYMWLYRTGADTDRPIVLYEYLSDLSPQERYLQRLEQEKPVLDAFLAWANTRTAAPKSALGKALTYLKEQWPYLVNYLRDGRLEISNNRAERSIKPFVIDRKNFLFANTPKGATGSAVIFSMIQTALENQLDPYRYLTWLLQTACGLDMADPAVIQKLLPWQAPDICKAK